MSPHLGTSTFGGPHSSRFFTFNIACHDSDALLKFVQAEDTISAETRPSNNVPGHSEAKNIDFPMALWTEGPSSAETRPVAM